MSRKPQRVAKVVTADSGDDELVQLRIWIDDRGWVELILNDAADIVAHTVGHTEKDAWKAEELKCACSIFSLWQPL